jgi:NADH-quinone oxidoreductase subunit E
MLAVKTNKPVKFSEAAQAKAAEIIERYPEGKHKSAILPLLHLAQEENDNWLSPETMDMVASLLKIHPVEVYEVASFYSMYNMKPVGKYVLEVCQTGPCAICGAEWLIDYLKSKLKVEAGGTSADGMFTLKPVECLGACGYAPMMQVGKYYYEHLNAPDKVDELLDKLRAGMIKQENWL